MEQTQARHLVNGAQDVRSERPERQGLEPTRATSPSNIIPTCRAAPQSLAQSRFPGLPPCSESSQQQLIQFSQAKAALNSLA
jgi:hypothetical protein